MSTNPMPMLPSTFRTTNTARVSTDRTKQQLFNMSVLKHKYEIWPLIGSVLIVGVLASSSLIYAAYSKPEVRLRKKSVRGPPWEEVSPQKLQKLITINQKYNVNPELEKLRKEIGSYRY